MAHLICTDQPEGRMAVSTQAALRRAGHCYELVGYRAALGRVEQGAFEAVVVDLERLNTSALSLLKGLWSSPSRAPVWLATRVGSQVERLVHACVPGRRLPLLAAGRTVSLQASCDLSATKLMALRQLCVTP